MELMEMEPLELTGYLQEHYQIRIPVQITTAQDLKNASKLLSEVSAYYSYFAQLALTAKIIKRNIKLERKDKKTINDAMAREEIFSLYAELMKQAYNATSRMVTIKLAVNEEMRMS